MPLEGGNTAPRDLQGLATLGLTRWVMNLCSAVVDPDHLGLSEKAEIILHLILYFLMV